MKATRAFFIIVMSFVLLQVGTAGAKNDIQKYFNDTACKVKATTDPVQKREILDKSLQTMSKALEKVESSGLVSEDQRAGIDFLKTAIQAKHDELAGKNGYERVDDMQLNAFSDYVVQDMQQADRMISFSLVTALLVLILLVLIL